MENSGFHRREGPFVVVADMFIRFGDIFCLRSDKSG